MHWIDSTIIPWYQSISWPFFIFNEVSDNVTSTHSFFEGTGWQSLVQVVISRWEFTSFSQLLWLVTDVFLCCSLLSLSQTDCLLAALAFKASNASLNLLSLLKLFRIKHIVAVMATQLLRPEPADVVIHGQILNLVHLLLHVLALR